MGEPFKLKNGSILVSTEAPGGLYNAAQLKKIAALCETDAAVAKATEDQRLALFIKPDKATMVVKELRAVGLGVRHYQDGIHQPVACIGQLCSEFKQDALASAMDLSESLRGVACKSSLKVGINGCSKCCVPTHTLDVSAIGDESGYRISIGGKTSQIPELASFLAEAVPANELTSRVTQLAKAFADQAQPGESLQEMIERCGASQFVQIFAPYSQDAADASDSFSIDGADSLSNETLNTDADVDAEMNSDQAAPPQEAATMDDQLNLSGEDEMAMNDVDNDSAELTDIDPSTAGGASMDDINLDISPEQETASGELDLNEEISLNAESQETLSADLALDSDTDLNLDSSAETEPALTESISDNADADLNLDGLEEEAIADIKLDENADLALDSDDAAVTLASESVDDSAAKDDLNLDLDGTESLELSVEEDVASANVEAAQTESEDLSLDFNDAAPEVEGSDASLAVAEVDLESDINLEDAQPEPVTANLESDGVDEINLTLDDDLEVSSESQESEEQNAETRLEESIAVEATIDETAEPDENADERAEALRLVSEQESEGMVAAKAPINPSLIPEDDLDLEMDDAPDFGEIAADLSETTDSVTQPRSSAPAALPSRGQGSSGPGFSGASVDPRGVVVLSFGTGMTIELNATELAFGSQDLQLGGQAVRIEKSNESVSVAVNGIRLNLPVRKAA